MFKKREKKNKDKSLNLAQQDLDGVNNSDEDIAGIIKKAAKKNLNLNQNNEKNANIKNETQYQISSVHQTASRDMIGDKFEGALFDVKANYNERQKLLDRIRQEGDKVLDDDYNQNTEYDKDGVKFYKGKKNYEKPMTEQQIRSAKFLGTMGPMQQQSNVKMTSTVDYNPERCKDWFEKGRCNFGDTCLYIHDRTDYKSGWEQEQDYRAKQKQRQLNGGHAEESTDEEDMEYAEKLENLRVPQYCSICDERFKEPVMTQCKHFFCESCALKHYQKSSTCAICNEKTNGQFLDAAQEIEKMRKEKKKIQKERNLYRKSVNKRELSESEDLDSEDEEEEENKNNNQNEDENENNNNNNKRRPDSDQEDDFKVTELTLAQNAKKNKFKLQNTDWNY